MSSLPQSVTRFGSYGALNFALEIRLLGARWRWKTSKRRRRQLPTRGFGPSRVKTIIKYTYGERRSSSVKCVVDIRPIWAHRKPHTLAHETPIPEHSSISRPVHRRARVFSYLHFIIPDRGTEPRSTSPGPAFLTAFCGSAVQVEKWYLFQPPPPLHPGTHTIAEMVTSSLAIVWKFPSRVSQLVAYRVWPRSTKTEALRKAIEHRVL